MCKEQIFEYAWFERSVMRSGSFVWMFVLVLMLPGCSTLSALQSFTTAYQEPLTPSSSRLRVTTDQTVRLIPGSACIDWSLPGAGIVNSRSLAVANNRKFNDRVLGVPGGKEAKNSSEVYVQPGNPIVLVYEGASRRIRCTESVYFVPEPGADYESNSGLCYMAIAKIIKSESSGDIRREAVKVGRAKICSR